MCIVALARNKDHHKEFACLNQHKIVRFLCTRWGGPDSPLPDGLIYEGISDTPEKVIEIMYNVTIM